MVGGCVKNTRLITKPVFSTVNGLRCTTLSGIAALSRWTLATTSGPMAVALNYLTAVYRTSEVWLVVPVREGV